MEEPLIQLPPGQPQNISTIQEGHPSQTPNVGGDGRSRRTRSKWTMDETHDLIKGCGIHGVGNWKKYFLYKLERAKSRILEDPTLKFNSRTSVDLKDRYIANLTKLM
jgi:hypothetical protein